MIYKTEEALLYKAKQAEGKTFGEIDLTGRITNPKSKGQLGQIIEESFFGYEVNSKSEADFADLGIELKVTPLKLNKNKTISAKERLVLNIINYHKEVLTTFETSSFWTKNQSILLMFYHWIPEVHRSEYQVLKSHLLTFSEEDLQIIKNDWKFITDKIKSGKAHELSEADTIYLGACTKGKNKESLRTQPFSPLLAMQRAYSLKASYITGVARKLLSNDDLVSFTNSQELERKTLEEILQDRFSPYIGKTLSQIALENGITINKSKSFVPDFVSALLGIKGTKLDDIEEFSKANIQFKTIRLEPSGIPREHMSFKNVNFMEWAKEDWDESWLKNHFEQTKFLFVVFEFRETERENKNRELFFKGVQLWNMPLHEIENRLRDFHQNLQQQLLEGVHIEMIQKGKKIVAKNDLPSPESNGLCHIRPKGKNGQDKTLLPDGQMIAKQAFWLDKEYVANLITF
ncbi:DNA mismatch repair endonuclease MutH [Paenisporosarcina sp. HGH0030]|uniref:Sau3AI family type II restriction endonuclease n=1 Tax=Paenisporosarcina sp. HGH0030 TaxID=1078085 RepID=UPI00034EAA11|nr:Sau3AI family type II restriction endonuclease [Paenisporosarcina sp. HGH0030]EPD49466.1 DNA mismatch repair endonuclease MutH [Paenisporosarcina sp. HGH0030]